MQNKIELFQSSNGEIVFNSDIQNETIWANLGKASWILLTMVWNFGGYKLIVFKVKSS